jgi:hypothetical protein
LARGIYLIQDDEQLVEMAEQPYDSEDLLEALLAKFPSLLAGDQMGGTPRRWLLVGREAALPSEEDGADRWSVDHLFLDQEAVPTVVEVKRSSDSRIRREVVGQMLDYAASAVVYWPAERLHDMFERTCDARGDDPERLLSDHLDDDGDIDGFWERVATNLRAGRVRLVFVSDVIPPELQRVVEFLNTQMTPAEVLAIEVKQYVAEGLRTLVPRVVGQTAEAQQRKRPGVREYRHWDEESFVRELATQRSSTEAAVARRLIGWARKRGLQSGWGRGKVDGSFTPKLEYGGKSTGPVVVWTTGDIEVYLEWLKTLAPFDSEPKRREFVERLNEIPDVEIDTMAIPVKPVIGLAALTGEDALEAFVAALDWWFAELVESQNGSTG